MWKKNLQVNIRDACIVEKNKERVPVLFHKSMINSIKVILMFREPAEIHSKILFAFALPSDNNRVIEAFPMMTNQLTTTKGLTTQKTNCN